MFGEWKIGRISMRFAGRIIALWLPLSLAACTATPSNTATTVENTRHICSSCHGAEGRSDNPTFPNLAGQQSDYIQAQLKAFRDKSRADPHAHTYMWGMAAHLSDDTIVGLATFYSAQKPAVGIKQDPTEAAAGEKIFTEGIPATDTPACMGCHGEKAEGNLNIPRLAGQHRGVIERQLGAFALNLRANEIMHDVSKPLTPEQTRAVAAYLASL